MCGRFTLTVDGQVIQHELGLEKLPPDMQPRYNIAPSQPVGVVTNEQPKSLQLYKWGLIPFWSDDPGIGNRLINARSETAHEKPSFREAFKRRRCLIPADGFYEWRQGGGQKTPMYIHHGDGALFVFAGLWETWRADEGEVVHTCTILTTEAADNIKAIHHRMPVILPPDARDMWLFGESEVELRSVLKTYDGMQAYPVSSVVNSPYNDSPENIQPAEDPPQQQTLF